jgi:serine/threonine protein kinase/tetratricopeptide (TPR) repeat protein
MPRDRHGWEPGEEPTIAAPAPADQPTQRLGEGAPVPFRPGDAVGPYRLVEEIGSGGFGVVWRAEQREPISRVVAIKVIKPGMDTAAVVSRFEVERDALGVMDHPNIARVLDGGTTDRGLPCFVMEYVPGEPVTSYCSAHGLGLRARLELFTQVCLAVQHAHTKGVIHRDLKPSNILVREVDGEPVAKVIDFGVAKALRGKSDDTTHFTVAGEPIGTPAYMAPEQADGTERDVDTRADVYGLGVVLYELLTGRMPFDFHGMGWREMSRVLAETEPARPSTRVLSTVGDETPAGRSAVGRRAWARSLEHDLDWIVMRCLEKDRSRRYDAASDIAREIKRYLSGEPVLAGPPSVTYRVRKFVMRHRGGVAAASAGVAVLVLGLAGTSYGLVEAQRERERAEAAAASEADQRRVADQRAEELEQVSAFQAAQLAAIDPPAMGETILSEVLAGLPADDRALIVGALGDVNFTNVALRSLGEDVFGPTISAIEDGFPDQPLVKARLLQSVADTLVALGLTEMALRPQETALALRREHLGNDHADTLRSIDNTGGLFFERGLLDGAASFHGEALDGYTRLYGAEHPDTLNAMNNMGGLLFMRGDLDGAEEKWRVVLESYRRVLGDDDPDTLTAISNLGSLQYRRGEIAEAEALWREALEGRTRVLGEDHPDTLGSVTNVGHLLRELERFEEAEDFHVRAVESSRRVLGNDHPDTVAAVNNWGGLLNQLGRHGEALGVLGDSEDAARAVWQGDYEPFLGSYLVKLGEARGETGDLEGGVRTLLEAHGLLTAAFGTDHPRTRSCVQRLARVYGAWAEVDPDQRAEADVWIARAGEAAAPAP